MFRNYLAVALRNLARNWLYAGISVFGLAVGMVAAIITGLYIRDERSFDAFIPGHEQLYIALQSAPFPLNKSVTFALTPPQAASWLTQDYPGLAATTLCAEDMLPSLRHGEIEAQERLAWVDAKFFTLLPLPVVAGDPVGAAATANQVVITRSMARKFFGRDAPLGEQLEVNRTASLIVGAVIEDLPVTTNITQTAFASMASAAVPQSCDPGRPYPPETILMSNRTFVRIKDETVVGVINRAMPEFITRHMGFDHAWSTAAGLGGRMPTLSLIPLDDLHMTPLSQDKALAQGNTRALLSLALVAGLTLLVAIINFVNLMIARSARRMVEVGVRKVSGAQRRHLIAQFMSECAIYAMLGLLVATMMTDLALPTIRSAVGRPLAFDFWRDAALFGSGLTLSLVVGMVAGAYPALVLSRFRPTTALSGQRAARLAGFAARHVLVTLQFVILISLVLAVTVIGRQTRFAMNEGLRVDKDQVLMMDVAPSPIAGASRRGPNLVPRCRTAFVDAVRGLPGVRSAACSSANALDLDDYVGGTCLIFPGRNGQQVSLNCGDVDYGFFEQLGLRPVAGRFFSPDYPGDDALRPPSLNNRFIVPTRVVMNESAIRALGYERAADAVGQVADSVHPDVPEMEIVGVVPDFAVNLLRGIVQPTFYGMVTPRFDTLNIKLSGQDIPETVDAIDRLWKRLGEPRAPSHRFIDAYLQSTYATTLRQKLLVDGLCGIAVFLTALGLFGLSAFTAERRTKEIGVRKALGASRADILGLLMWEFARPVLWANAIAWPAAYVLMRRWLETFTYRIDMEPWMFLGASAAALGIALLTVAGHALLVARAEPVKALRYE